jgi:hypothetical protein
MRSPIHLPENDVHSLLQRLLVEVMKGIRHGHFDFRIECGGNKNGTRQVTFSAGLTHRYTIGLDTLPQNLFPQVTFQPKAPIPNPQPPLTPLQGARAALEPNDDPDTE